MKFSDDNWQPLAFFSSQLRYIQRKWSAYDRELLAVYENLKHFRHMVEARSVTIFTDQKPLTFAFKQKLEKCSPRQFRHLDFISQFTTDIRHISGVENIVADALSRIEISEITCHFDIDLLSSEQAKDEELQRLLHENNSTLTLKHEYFTTQFL